jgi:2-iminobutanoate/2-iminopropanoate deaminase
MIEFLMVTGAPTPVAPFSHAVAADGWVFVTGQMPTDPLTTARRCPTASRRRPGASSRI